MNNSIHILLLEDNPNDAELAQHQVFKSGIKFKWLHVSEWDEFVAAINSFKPDIILSDYKLGSFTGIDALEFAKINCPLIPFIIVTGALDEETAADTIKRGAVDYVVKERLSRLDSAIKNALLLKVEKEKNAVAQEKLKTNEKRYRLIFDNAPEALFISDMKGVTIEGNHALEELFGLRKEDIIGKNFFKLGLLQNNQIPYALKIITEKIGSKTHHPEELIIKRSDGREVITELNVHFVDYLGEKHMLGIARDITNRKRAEEALLLAKEKAEESDQLKTAFLHNISHEIRTPLNAIVGFSGILNDPGLTPEKRKHFFDIILQSSDQLLSIIDDIINISSIEVGQEKIIENKININSISNHIKEQLSAKISDKNVTLSLKTILPDDEAFIIADETKLTQILTNLVGNALKFTKEGYVNFGYTVKDRQLEFYVADSGIGIPLDMQDKIFNRFQQVETTSTRKYGGSGLGLSISKAYTEMLGGKIWLTSELGKGSIFYFTIPYLKVNVKKISDTPSIKGSGFDFKDKTLLIAEDEDSNFKLLEELLSDTRINIKRVVNGIEAVEICKSNPDIDLVLMDLKMPVMDGFQAAKRIKEINPDLTIIAQTAYYSDTDKNKAFACGCSEYMGKPINREQLISILNEQLFK